MLPNCKTTVLLCSNSTNSYIKQVITIECGLNLDMMATLDYLLLVLYDGITSIMGPILPPTQLMSMEAPNTMKSILKKSSYNGGTIQHSGQGHTSADPHNSLMTTFQENPPPNFVNISNEEFYNMQGAVQTLLTDFLRACREFRRGKRLISGKVEIVLASKENIKDTNYHQVVSGDNKFELRAATLWVSEDQQRKEKPHLSFPPWLTRAQRADLHSSSNKMNCISRTIDGALQIYPDIDAIAAYARAWDRPFGAPSSAACDSISPSIDVNGFNTEVHKLERKFYDAYVERYGGKLVIMEDGYHMQVKNRDEKSVFWDTEEWDRLGKGEFEWKESVEIGSYYAEVTYEMDPYSDGSKWVRSYSGKYSLSFTFYVILNLI